MINRHMKRFSASLIISKMQIKTTVWRYQSEWPPLKSQQITNAVESGQKREPPTLLMGMWIGAALWRTVWRFFVVAAVVALLSYRDSFCDPMDCSPPGSSIHGTSQARILEWVAISLPRESSQPSNQICASCIGRWILHHWATIWRFLKKLKTEHHMI